MEKQEVEFYKTTRMKHKFYCDDCEKYLGTSVEYDDGYYPQIGEYYFRYHNMHVKKHLCDECKEKFENKITTFLKELGFR